MNWLYEDIQVAGFGGFHLFPWIRQDLTQFMTEE